MNSNITTNFLKALFKAYDDDGIDYCLLRNYESLPEAVTSNDIDLILSRKYFSKNRTILKKLVETFGLVLYHYYDSGTVIQFYLYKRLNDDTFDFIKLDFHTDAQLYGIVLIPGDEILRAKTKYKSFYVALPMYAFLDKWLYQYMVGGSVPQRYRGLLKEMGQTGLDELQAYVIRIFGRTKGEDIYSRLIDDQRSDIPKMDFIEKVRVLLRNYSRQPVENTWNVSMFLLSYISYSFSPAGEMVSFSGPDGSGKTTLLEISLKTLQRALPVNLFHARPSLLPRIANVAKTLNAVPEVDENYHRPYRAVPSNVFGSLARLTYYCIDYLLGYLIRIHPLLFQRQFVIFDRYYYDIIADPDRARIALPFWFLNNILYFLPCPATAFFIFASPETIALRKQELTPDRITLLNERYERISRKWRNFIRIDNEGEPNRTAADVVDAVLTNKASRIKVFR